jgi:copper oxidase (laccase) domain-containing protein
VDLRRVAVAQLQAVGVPPQQIDVRPECTRCDPDRFASYRAQSEDAGTNVALVALRT